MTESGDADLSSSLAELLQLDQERRLALITRISELGFGPGCWLRVPEDRIIHPVEAARFIGELLPGIARLDAHDSIEEFDGELPWAPPTDGEPAWLIVSQVCDLVRDISDEPLVQVVPLMVLADADLGSLGRRSSRLVPLDPTGRESRYVADLRVHAFVAKTELLGCEPLQAIPPDNSSKTRPRTRFPLRVGQRFSRDGIPTPLVESLVEPLKNFIEKGDKQRKKNLDAAFVEFLLIENYNATGKHRLIAVVDIEDPEDDPDFADAEDFFAAFLNALPSGLAGQLDLDDSEVRALNAVYLGEWLDAWRLDFDFVTFGSKGDASSPAPRA